MRACVFTCTHCTCTLLCDFAVGTNGAEGDGDAGGVGDVAKQLEQQVLEDKEKEEDGEEGNSSPSSSSCLNFKEVELHSEMQIVISAKVKLCLSLT